jgi:hypothetical protein
MARVIDHMADPFNEADREPTEVANYVATLSADLATMARGHGLQALAYLLDMVRLEAENASGVSMSVRKTPSTSNTQA